MRKILRVSTPFLLLFLTLSFAQVKHDEVPMSLIGSWEYMAPNIGLKYQSGSLEFSYEEEELKGKVIFWNREIPMENVVFEDNKVRAHITLEGEQIDLFLRFESNSFKGTVSHPQGYLRITGNKRNI